MGFVGLCVVVLFVVPPLLAPSYSVRQGVYSGEVTATNAGMGMAARPVMRVLVELEDGRGWWVRVPATQAVAPGMDIEIELWCQSEAFEACSARYAG